jgi:hypothetical protein
MYKKLLFSFLLLFAALIGCIKESDLPDKVSDLSFNSGFPIAFSTLTLKNVISSSDPTTSLQLTSDGYYKFVFGPFDYDFPAAGDFIKLPNKNITDISASPNFIIPPTPNPLSTVLSYITTVSGFDFTDPSNTTNNYLQGAKLNNIFLNEGTFTVTFQKIGFDVPTNTVMNLTVTVLNLVDSISKVPVKIPSIVLKDQLPNSTNITFSKSQVAQLSLSGQNLLTLKIDFGFTTSKDNEISGGFKLSSVAFTTLKWSKIEAKLGTFKLPFKQNGTNSLSKFSLSTFENNFFSKEQNPNDIVHIENPLMTMTFTNYFGFPLALEINPLAAKKADSSSVDILLDQIKLSTASNDNNVVKPTINVSTVPSSSVNTLISSSPVYLSYGAYMIVDGTKTQNTDFILSDSKVKSKINMEIPAYGYLKSFQIKDDVSVDFSNLNVTSSTGGLTVNEATFKVDYVNAIPIEFTLQIYFLDQKMRIFDSLFTRASRTDLPKINGATVNASGLVASSATPSPIITETVDANRFSQISSKAKFIRFKAAISTSNSKSNTNVKIFPTDKLQFQISIKGKGTYKF